MIVLQILFAIGALMSCTGGLPVARHNNRDSLPNLNDALSVAKSPLEAVTMPISSPAARNDNQIPMETTKSDAISHKQTSRAINFVEQQQDSTPSVGSLSDSDSSTQTDSNEATTTELVDLEATTPLIEKVSENTQEEVERQITTVSTTTTTLTTTTTTTDSPATAAATNPTTTESPTTTTEAPRTSAATSSTSKVADETTASEDHKSAVSSEGATTSSVAPELLTTLKPSNVFDTNHNETLPSNEKIANEEVTTLASTTSRSEEEKATTDAAESSTQPTTTERIPSTTELIETTSTTTPATTELPASTTPEKVEKVVKDEPVVIPEEGKQVDSENPATTATATTLSIQTTQKPSDAQSSTIKEEKENKNSCNHLPTYEADELQKVFREETTYKNGTIKGKFTYINFDARYRLVHYTRLPYGPVKIDLVEELGKPEQAGNPNSTQSANEVPNAVLQLRNILPNSLFGFPFINPNANANKQTSTGKDKFDDKTSQYFYSTDSISTPNLQNPSAPVLPDQRKATAQSAPDTLSQNLYDNLMIGPEQKSQSESAKEATKHPTISQQFQYASPEVSKQHPGLVYSFLSQQNPQAQYQYSPVALYSFNQPQGYYSASAARQMPLIPSQADERIKENSRPEPEPFPVAAHQPHSHEHYVAPFMFSQPSSLYSSEQSEASRLKLRVKASKSLNQESYGKSAQLQDSTYLQSPVYTPTQIHFQAHRQRVGKQQNEFKQSINSNPIVYHVLRSPMGRMYSLQQYNQAHAMAYDHDD